MFISFEGVEGVGKSTQIKLLQEYFTQKNIKCITTHEPGGTEIGEEITKLVKFYNGKEKIADVTETLLFYASRYQLIENVIRPNLAKKTMVITDRFYDSSYAYQGYGRGVDLKLLKQLNKLIVGNIQPDITFLLHSDEDTLERAKIQTAKETNKQDRFESEKKSFLERIKNGFLSLSKEEPQRIVLVDASLSIDEVFAKIKLIIDEYIR